MEWLTKEEEPIDQWSINLYTESRERKNERTNKERR